MERYSQFRDRGSGISPFLPVTTPISTFTWMLHSFVFVFRLPIFLFCVTFYFLLLNPLPLPLVARKLLLGGLMAIPGIWWVDLQLDGVKRGHLSQQPRSRVPHGGSVIAANYTSPIDALYLAAIFDPVFTISYPGTRKVQRTSLLGAVLHAFASVATEAPNPNQARLTTVQQLLQENPHRVIVVFPECSTTNGRGILPFSPSLLSAPASVRIFPVSIRYTPPDISTPVPGSYLSFLWNLLSRPTHTIRVRIAESVSNTSQAVNGVVNGVVEKPTHDQEEEDSADEDAEDDLEPEEQRVLDRIGEALARLGRNKRVGLTLRDKASFVQAFGKRKK